MLYVVKVLSTELDNLKRRVVKFLRFGKRDVQTSLECAPFGIDSSPIKDMVAIYAETAEKGKTVLVGYINRNQLAAPGETRLYATNANGEVQTFIWLRSDGTVEIGGGDDFLLRFSKTKEVVDELQADINALKQAFTNWVPVPNDGGNALKIAAGAWTGAALTKNIDAAKIEQIKTL